MSVITGNNVKDPPPREKGRGMPPRQYRIVMGFVFRSVEQDCRRLLTDIFGMNAGQVSLLVDQANVGGCAVIYKAPKDAVDTKLGEVKGRVKQVPKLRAVAFRAESCPS